MNAAIVNNRIAGTRITVWDVLHHLENNWSQADIADVLGLTEDQVQAAVEYIEGHREAVLMVHRQIEQRNKGGNSPDVLEKIAAARAKRQGWMKDRVQLAKR